MDQLAGVNQNLWMPPIISPIGGGNASTIGAIFSFGILLLLAKVPDIIKSAFEKQQFGYGAAIGQAMGAPFMAAKTGLTGFAQTAQTVEKALGTEEQPGWARRATSAMKGKRQIPIKTEGEIPVPSKGRSEQQQRRMGKIPGR